MADNNIDPNLVRELTEKYEQMRDAIASMVPAMVLSTTAINQMIAASKGLTVSEKDGTEVVKEYIKSISEATEKTEEETKAKEKSDKVWNRINTTLNNIGLTLGSFGSALLNTTNSMSKYQATVNAGAKGITDLAESFMPKDASMTMKLLFKGFTGLVNAISFFVGAVFKQNDIMIKSFDSLSEVGATSQLTTNDIRLLGQNAGYTGDKLEKFTDITKGLGTDLLGLGTTAGKGVVEFSKIASVTDETRAAFNRLGIGQEELTKIQANYVKTTIASGRSLAKSPEMLQKESLKYATTIQELNALTGMNRDSQQKTLDEANANLNFQIHMYELGKKEMELRSQGRIAEADAVKRQIDNTNSVVIVSKKMNSALDHTATLQLLAGKTWTESSAGLAAKMPGLLKMFSRLDKGEDITSDFMDGMANATESMLRAAGGAMKIGEAGPEIAKALGISVESVKFLAEYRSKDAEQRKAALAQIRKEISEKKAGQGAFDAAKEAQNAQIATEIKLQKAFDELVNMISGPVNGAFVGLMKTTLALAKLFANISYSMGGPDLRYLFKTEAEFAAEIKDLTEDAKKLETALDKEVNLREEKRKVDEEALKKDKEYNDEKNKLYEMRKNRPSGEGKSKEEHEKDIKEWQDKSIEQDKKVKQLELERSALLTKGYQLKRELEQRGMGSGTTAKQEKLRAELEQKKKQLEDTKKQAQQAKESGINFDPGQYQKVAPRTAEQEKARAEAQAGLGKGVAGRENDILKKLNFKDKEENTGGGKADAKLLHIAEKIGEAFPNGTFTALNDKFHQNDNSNDGKITRSRHTEGKALDFTVNPPPANAYEAEVIKRKLEDLGASKVLDEYFTQKSSKSTGGHFHVEVMKDGGIIKAQSGGTMVQAAEAGMNEAFVPLPNGKSIPVSIPGLEQLTQIGLDKLNDKLDPEKMMLKLLSKNIPGFDKIMTAANIAGTAGSEEMSTTEKILEIAKMLNPTVRLITKLYDTYQTIAGDGFSAKTNTSVPDVNTIINSQVEQQQASQQELITKLSTAITSNPNSGDNSSAMIEMLASKLDTMIDKLDTSNDIQDDLLKYSRS
jgi:hypothetical protein